jgi:hypothetical protein
MTHNELIGDKATQNILIVLLSGSMWIVILLTGMAPFFNI